MMKIFVNCIHEEADFVAVLKDWIESTFPDKCEVFFSSDQDDNSPGAKWPDKIDQAITDSGIMIAVCSPTSMAQPWVILKIGCAWVKEIPIILICHSGLTKSALPPPIATFQALDFSSKFPKQIITAIAKYLEVSKIPRLSFGEMYSELQDALPSSDKVPSEEKVDVVPPTPDLKEEEEQVDTSPPTPDLKKEKEQVDVSEPTPDLKDEEIEILKLLAKEGQSLALMFISDVLHIKPAKAEKFIDHLVDIDYIFHTIASGSPTSYSLNKHGLAYLVKKDLV